MAKTKKAAPKKGKQVADNNITKRRSFKRATSTPLSKSKVSLGASPGLLLSSDVTIVSIKTTKKIKTQSILETPKRLAEPRTLRASKRTANVIKDESSPKKRVKRVTAPKKDVTIENGNSSTATKRSTAQNPKNGVSIASETLLVSKKTPKKPTKRVAKNSQKKDVIENDGINSTGTSAVTKQPKSTNKRIAPKKSPVKRVPALEKESKVKRAKPARKSLGIISTKVRKSSGAKQTSKKAKKVK